MARVQRYTQQLVAGYERDGHWNGAYPVDFWESNALRDPHRDALVFGAQRYTWKTAVEAIHKLAMGLVSCGLRRNDVIALQAPNSAALMLLRLAAEKAGVVALLVPATFSRAEVGAITERLPLAGAVLSERARAQDLANVYRAGARESFALFSIGGSSIPGACDIESWLDVPYSATEAGRVLDGRRLQPYEYAAIITTSGTTEIPRFVEHTACARNASGRVYIDRLQLTHNDVVVGMVSIFAGNCDLLVHHTAPQVGARIVLVDHFDPQLACRLIESERATCAVFVPTLLHRLLAYDGLRRHDLSSLRVVTSFGAILAPGIAAEVERILGAKVIQGYGASDYGSLASAAIDDPDRVRLTGVGRPLTGTELRICDANGVAVPAGTPGRIFARGPHCVGGFVQDTAATEQAWATGYYAMGDFGHLDQDGYLWLSGRVRELVIRGGQNIVPGEVEDAILAHPHVAEAAVIGVPDAEMGERVCAAVVPRDGVRVTLESITAHLSERGLARFKHPERLFLIDALPLNPAATKVDKRALLEMALGKEIKDSSAEVSQASTRIANRSIRRKR